MLHFIESLTYTLNEPDLASHRALNKKWKPRATTTALGMFIQVLCQQKNTIPHRCNVETNKFKMKEHCVMNVVCGHIFCTFFIYEVRVLYHGLIN